MVLLKESKNKLWCCSYWGYINSILQNYFIEVMYASYWKPDFNEKNYIWCIVLQELAKRKLKKRGNLILS